MTDQIIATIPKNANEELRISLTEYQGHRLCAVRVYYDPRDGGDMRPGKSGVNVRLTMLPEIIEALQEAWKQAGGGKA
ncbi:hypothetical protein VE25_07480 [Devosia geojensis]|uniref:Transcriptional coactivator p15 (PC4) C-terminal domain-containing protein n=1 Tax=Devosia geojensis TaxID=443610 RepID=A0A0F5FU33_9HYPH|nr:transcriptional coactivator p15/PC4 family protein [Devosia geojensis]KKB12384.1 hypothetical protein VE25_07480 [Devosia geojensis]